MLIGIIQYVSIYAFLGPPGQAIKTLRGTKYHRKIPNIYPKCTKNILRYIQGIQEILDKTSKRNTGKRGEPDLIYLNEANRLLILIENKHAINDHQSENDYKPTKYAVDGITHYLSFFTPENLSKHPATIGKYFEDWSVVGIAFSGDIHDEYNHLISTFIITDEGKIKDIETPEILDEEDYIAFFENIDIESISKNIAKSSSEINRLLRTLNSQDRPVLLSALMICLYDKNNFSNDFKNSYSHACRCALTNKFKKDI